jgi:hypothetical protein
MWQPRRLTTLWAFRARYRDSFTFSPYKFRLNITLGHTVKSHRCSFFFSFSDTILYPFRTTSFIRNTCSAHLVILNLITRILLIFSIFHHSAVFRTVFSYIVDSTEALPMWTATSRYQSQLRDTVKVQWLESLDAVWQPASVGVLSHGDSTLKTAWFLACFVRPQFAEVLCEDLDNEWYVDNPHDALSTADVE